MPTTAIVDTGPLVAAADRSDDYHQVCLDALGDPLYRLVIPALCVAEATYLIGLRLGPPAEARFLAGIASFDIRAPMPDDWLRIAELVERYANFPLGGTDASVVALAERLRADTVITLDRRHFGAIRPAHCESLRLVPA